MPFANLTANAQAGLNYAAAVNKRPDGSQIFATGIAYMDGQAETLGQEWYKRLLAEKDAKRAAVLADSKNAVLAAQVDSLAADIKPAEDIKG